MNKAVQLLEWKDVSSLVEEVNPVLARLIHDISPDARYPVVKVNYAFGDLMVKEGFLQIPSEQGKLQAIIHEDINKKIQSYLSYSPIPLSLILNKNSEVFLCEEEKTIPLNILKAGSLFGTFETIDFMFERKSSSIWNVTAGLRSIFALPKINEFFGIKRLRSHYHLSLDTQLKYLSQHWSVFKEIARSPLFSSPWKNEVLFFTKPWFMQRNDPQWFKLYSFLFSEGWGQAQYAIAELKLGPFWRECIQTIAHRRLKPAPFLIDTIKHLLAISMGLAPGLASTNSEADLPLKELQQALTQVYLLDHYIPTILGPTLFGEEIKIAYYSLAFPTLSSGLSYYQTNSSFMLDIKTIKLIIESLIKYYPNQPLFQNIQFEYFHTEKDQDNEIALSSIIPEEDKSFLDIEQKFSEKYFCASSSFWRGCVRVMSKNNSN